MEKSEACQNTEDASSLSRNRSFKSKQLVRSQAIRESQSPPRTSSPAVALDLSNLSLEETSKDNSNVKPYHNIDAKHYNADMKNHNTDTKNEVNVKTYSVDEKNYNTDVNHSTDVKNFKSDGKPYNADVKNYNADGKTYTNVKNYTDGKVYTDVKNYNVDNKYSTDVKNYNTDVEYNTNVKNYTDGKSYKADVKNYNVDSKPYNADVKNYKDAENGNGDVKREDVKDARIVEGTDPSSQSSDDVFSVNNASERISDYNDEAKKIHQVEIQITGGGWDETSSQRVRARRWLGSHDLLSNNPRLACVCGACAACLHCRGSRRQQVCPTKQDSGIVCSDDCPDCTENDNNGATSKISCVETDGPTMYCRCPERKDKPKSLSRTDSEDKSEPSGPELVNFLKETLNKNARDRSTLLKIEKDLHSLVNDTGRCIVRFPVMTSYGRMLVHRCAALFQLGHHLDTHNKTCVLVSKSGTSGGRIPCTPFKAWCTTNFPPSPQRHPDNTHAKSILKRDAHSLDEPGAGSMTAARSKSLEQREKEYERVRRRIFSSDNCTQDESQWPWLNSGPVKLLTPESGRNKLLKVQSLESGSVAGGSGRGPGAVSKSHSFGGLGDQHRAPTRLLSRQGDLASSSWRLSPSSSGYRTLSLHSTDSVTPSPTGGASPEPTGGVVWAVTDLSAVPRGALVIHPQTGRPLTNPDGSVYHFDPSNPPVLCDPNFAPEHNKVDQNNEKRRGRLEKQHSFIDTEADCQVTEDCHSKCCCDCSRHQKTYKVPQISPQPDQKPVPKPTSPCKNRYETTAEPTANYNAAPELTTNHRPPYEPPNPKPAPETNQRFENKPSYSPTINQKPKYERVELQKQASFETNKFEPANHRAPVEVANHRAPVEVANHRPPKVPSQENQEVQFAGQQYTQYRHDEVPSPALVTNHMYQPQDMVAMQQINQQKMAQMQMDPNMRPMSLTNMVYPAPIPQPYQYVNQCRMDQPLPTMYQQIIQDDKQMAPAPHPQENTFRIDPSYPYAGVDYGTAACCAPACMDQQHSHRSGGAGAAYGVDGAVTYALPGVMVPQHIHYPYGDQVQWSGMQQMLPVGGVGSVGKLYVPDVYSVGVMQYPHVYPQYNPLIVPQVLPQYPVCQPVYPAVESTPAVQRRGSFTHNQRLAKRNSVAGSPVSTPPRGDTPHTQRLQQQQQQIQVSRSRVEPKRAECPRRNSGSGLLGSAPNAEQRVDNARSHNRPANDDSQLTSAARAIVNSIRSMQAKNTYGERRAEYSPLQYRERGDPRRRDDGKERDRRPHCTPAYLLRQMAPGTWCRRSPGPVHPVLNNPRRPHPDNRNPRR